MPPSMGFGSNRVSKERVMVSDGVGTHVSGARTEAEVVGTFGVNSSNSCS